MVQLPLRPVEISATHYPTLKFTATLDWQGVYARQLFPIDGVENWPLLGGLVILPRTVKAVVKDKALAQ